MKKEIEHKDWLGQKLKVGDYVIYNLSGYFRISKILRFTSKKIEIDVKNYWKDYPKYKTRPDKVILYQGNSNEIALYLKLGMTPQKGGIWK